MCLKIDRKEVSGKEIYITIEKTQWETHQLEKELKYYFY